MQGRISDFLEGGRADFQKIFENFVDQIDFSSSPKALKRRCFRQIFEKSQKKPFLGIFWKILTKKLHFFWRALPPSKLVYIGAKGAFRKILGSVEKWISLKFPKGTLWVGRGSNPFGSTVRPPKSSPGLLPCSGWGTVRAWSKYKVWKDEPNKSQHWLIQGNNF